MDWRIYISFIQLIIGARALTCLQCKGVSQPRHCTIVDECFPGEVCGTEKITTPVGHTVYNVGCIKPSKCQSNSTTHDGIIQGGCIGCCQSDLCNAQGCGEPGYPQNRGPICFNCQLHTSIGACNDITFCEQGDVCKFVVSKEFGDIVYTGECSSAHECKNDNNQVPGIVGRDVANVQDNRGSFLARRSLVENVCTGCCDSDLCNKGCNGTRTISVTDFCQSSPCQYVSCVSKGNNYTCACPPGFGGLHCDKELTDCLDIYNHQRERDDGIYTVKTWKTHQEIKVYCDMTTASGGWTVFQHRFDKSMDFFRNFSQYENGFGDLSSEFWLGLRYIQEIASQGSTFLRINVEANNGTDAFETFNMFKLLQRPAYALYLGATISSNRIYEINRLGHPANGSRFSTFDNDVDTSNSNCASDYHGGWWYDNCFGVDLNGREIFYHGFVYNIPLKSSKMMIKRN